MAIDKDIDRCISNFRASGEDVRLMLWDTAGQEEFNAITKAYYRGAQVGRRLGTNKSCSRI